MSDIEIEIQVKVEGVSNLINYLNDKAKFIGNMYQKDEYFIPQHRNFVDKRPVEEWLRLRKSKKDSITYKKWYYEKDGKSTHCDEYETNVDDVSKIKKIFKSLDYRSVILVEKNRSSWIFNDYEVSIDKVTNLGDFVEVEYKGTNDKVNPKKIIKEMIKFLKSSGCKKVERNFMGYPFMILYPNEVKFEEV
jgi:adenylate cyclase, class 2